MTLIAALALLPPSSGQTTLTEAPLTTLATPATSTQTSPNPCFLSIGTQTDGDGATAIQKLEDEVATYKAIVDKAKEHLEEARKDTAQREASLTRTITDQTVQLRKVDEKIATTITSFQDIATAQIAMVTKELVEMQARSSQFLQQVEQAEKERSRLYDELHTHQMATILEREAEHKKHMEELEEARTEFSQQFDKITKEIEARVQSLTTTCDLLMAQLRLELNQAK